MKRIISILLILTTLFSVFAITASAARKEEFISEVALVYEDSVEEARKSIEGTDWKLFEYDLNKEADFVFNDGVYLIYKTSTDVEDAITDLRVMDMYGGYKSSNYQSQLENTRAEYMTNVSRIRTAAAEFKALYDAGDRVAALAYRQMNYYKDVKTPGGTETDMLMGDFFLNLPTDNQIVQFMMEGNSYIVINLIALLSIGISGEDSNTLAAKIAEKYAIKDTLTDEEYHQDAVNLEKEFKELQAIVKRYDALSEEYDLEDDDIGEAEYQFLVEYGVSAMALANIPYGDTTLKDFIAEGNWTSKDLYPIIAALSEGQRAISAIGGINLVLQYASSSKPIDQLYAEIDEVEAGLKDENGNIKIYDIYMGVDRSIFKGDFAYTNAAERHKASTGADWITHYDDDFVEYFPLDAMIATFATGFVLASAKAAAMELVYTLMALSEKAIPVISKLAGMGTDALLFLFSNSKYGGGKIYWTGTPYLGLALMLIAVGVTTTVYLVGYFNPDYTPIPNTIVDVQTTDLGDKYVRYDAAKVFGDEEGRNADFNAYQGKEWNALYYTKDANAGNSLTANFVFSETSNKVARRHQGVSMFGEDEAFNLNSHVFDNFAKGAYLTVRYSATKKAAASVPPVIGSVFATGAVYALVAFGGAGIGTGALLLLQRNDSGVRGKKKDEAAD